ncbi:MAG: hypothetical protein K5772_04605 [Clostridia bacterium]|nr:hypothetical protein [Clostridia bacterium]
MQDAFEKGENRQLPIEVQLLNIRYRKLDQDLKETADYIKAGNIDPKVLYEKQKAIANSIASAQQTHGEIQEVLDDPKNNKYEEFKGLFGGYDHKKFQQMEPVKGQNLLSMCGETKSAAKWIEDVYKEIKSPVNVTEERVALIFAARQLGNAVYDQPANIKNTRISEAVLRNHAKKLMASQEFRDYFKTVKDLDLKKTVKHGHGGYLEKTFENFLTERNAAELPFDVNDRYRRVIDAANPKPKDISELYDYKNYGEYFEKNKGNVVTSKEVHAARMAASDALRREDPNAPFDKKTLDAKARSFMKDPAFKLMMAMPGKMDMIVNGDAPGLAASVKNMNDTCRSMLDSKGEFDNLGFSHISLDRLEKRVEENPDLKPVVDSVKELRQGKKEPKDIVKTLNTIVDYQDRHAGDKLAEPGKDLNDSLRLLHELTNGTALNGIVDTQIDKVNKARNYKEGDYSFVTHDYIAKEGREADKQLEREVDGGDLNKSFDNGHEAVF